MIVTQPHSSSRAARWPAELRAVLAGQGLDDVEVRYLPANLHNRPERIVPALRRGARRRRRPSGEVFVAYADCGTGGALDAFLAEHPGIERLPGAHCYEFFAGSERFAALHDAEPGTFYLTDFLAKHFDALVWQGLGLDRHPALLPTVLRQLPTGRAAVPGGRPSRARRRQPRPPNGSGSSSTTSTPGSSRSPPQSPSASTARSRDMPRATQRGRRHHVAGHPRPGQRPVGPRPAPGGARRQVPARDRPGQAQGAHRHRPRGRRPVAPGEHALRRRSGGRRRRPTARRLDAEYSDERLGTLAFNGGVE